MNGALHTMVRHAMDCTRGAAARGLRPGERVLRLGPGAGAAGARGREHARAEALAERRVRAQPAPGMWTHVKAENDAHP